MLGLCLVQTWILQKEDSSLSGVGKRGRLTLLEVGVGPVLGASMSSSLGMSHLTQKGPLWFRGSPIRLAGGEGTFQ